MWIDKRNKTVWCVDTVCTYIPLLCLFTHSVYVCNIIETGNYIHTYICACCRIPRDIGTSLCECGNTATGQINQGIPGTKAFVSWCTYIRTNVCTFYNVHVCAWMCKYVCTYVCTVYTYMHSYNIRHRSCEARFNSFHSRLHQVRVGGKCLLHMRYRKERKKPDVPPCCNCNCSKTLLHSHAWLTEWQLWKWLIVRLSQRVSTGFSLFDAMVYILHLQ